MLLQVTIDLIIVVDSKDLYTTLTTKRQSIDRSVPGDIRVIRYEFEIRNVVKVVWIPGRSNPADIGTKFDSSLIFVVTQMISDGTIPFPSD